MYVHNLKFVAQVDQSRDNRAQLQVTVGQICLGGKFRRRLGKKITIFNEINIADLINGMNE